VDFTGEWLITSLIVGTIGFGIFVYGKKQRQAPQLLAGIALMAISWLVASPVWMSACAVAVIGALWAATKHA
jgi:hypothetical protein